MTPQQFSIYKHDKQNKGEKRFTQRRRGARSTRRKARYYLHPSAISAYAYRRYDASPREVFRVLWRITVLIDTRLD